MLTSEAQLDLINKKKEYLERAGIDTSEPFTDIHDNQTYYSIKTILCTNKVLQIINVCKISVDSSGIFYLNGNELDSDELSHQVTNTNELMENAYRVSGMKCALDTIECAQMLSDDDDTSVETINQVVSNIVSSLRIMRRHIHHLNFYDSFLSYQLRLKDTSDILDEMYHSKEEIFDNDDFADINDEAKSLITNLVEVKSMIDHELENDTI